MNRKVFLFACSFFFVFFLNAEQLDFIFKQPVSQLTMSHMRKKGKLTISAPLELVDYRKKNKIFSYHIREAVFRFSEDKKLRSADITMIATMNDHDRNNVRHITTCLRADLDKLFKQKGRESKLVFPNRRVIETTCWETDTLRIYLWHSDPVKKTKGVSFSHLRWEIKSYPVRKYFSWYAAAVPPYNLTGKNGDRIVVVPHRKQSGVTGKCAPTVVSCQLAQCGSEIPPVILWAFWDKIGEGKAMERIENLLGVKYISRDFGVKNPASNSLIALQEYNKLAEKHQKPKIKYKMKEEKYFWGDNFSNSDPELWEKLKKPNFKGYSSFKKYVINNIDRNIPVSWSLKRHNGRSRHRRMIIGYNLQKNVVYYYDTWGNSRNMRSMSFKAAFVMTIWSERIICRR